jgi:hypothetical protein
MQFLTKPIPEPWLLASATTVISVAKHSLLSCQSAHFVYTFVVFVALSSRVYIILIRLNLYHSSRSGFGMKNGPQRCQHHESKAAEFNIEWNCTQ